MPQLADDLVRELHRVTQAPIVLFGHSLGAYLALDCAHLLEAAGSSVPLLCVAAARAPDDLANHHRVRDSSDEEFTELLRSFGATPAELLDHPEIMKLLLPVLRADFLLAEEYVPVAGLRLAAAVTAFSGRHDPLAPPESMHGWGHYGKGDLELHALDAGHFFVSDVEPVAGLVLGQMRSLGLVGPERDAVMR